MKKKSPTGQKLVPGRASTKQGIGLSTGATKNGQAPKRIPAGEREARLNRNDGQYLAIKAWKRAMSNRSRRRTSKPPAVTKNAQVTIYKHRLES